MINGSIKVHNMTSIFDNGSFLPIQQNIENFKFIDHICIGPFNAMCSNNK